MKYCTTNIQIRFGDTDMLGHVNNANYLSYIELARLDFSDKVLPQVNWKVEGFILAKSIIDYIKPIFLKDQIVINSWVSKIGNKSFDIEYEIIRHNAPSKEVVCRAQTVQVAFDYENQISKIIPSPWLTALKQFEKK